ncbi:S8 family serine peptidase [Streptomyces griseiscabiei]|uniref:S8 family serine peptidase n=1 Tax=Streptomyces griseiscabiei TaxID=2993540 RepID=A0ABU4L6T1_9ACTN|nr:S8 family serine peptidase [Streptomyces griseiscabiei]MBZ3906441.1 S8 family serine peptidase [Streptomyces griseiscabiei]MDX2911436.1 S8 family serine peptidase [Streptomyces griseiscabiei]
MAEPLEQTGLARLMARGAGRPEIVVAVVDGLVALGHPGLAGRHLRVLPGGTGDRGGQGDVACRPTGNDASCRHGTYVVGLLGADRTSRPPGICPGCTFLLRPIFAAGHVTGRPSAPAMPATPAVPATPAARPEDLAAAIVECVDAGARVLNLSVAPDRPSSTDHRELEWALDHAANRGVITIVAAGNQGTVGTSVLTRHPWTVPVVAYDQRGRPMNLSNLGGSIGARGLGAPGEGVVGLGVDGRPLAVTGTSAAAPFVAGAVALLLSAFPTAPPADVRSALLLTAVGPRRTVVPPFLDAWAAYTALARTGNAPLPHGNRPLKSPESLR